MSSTVPRLFTLVLVAVTAVSAQSPAPPAARFDVVSVKPSQPGGRGGPGPFVSTNPGRLQARGPLIFLIGFAYGVRDVQIEGGPDWIRSDRFDIDAAMAPGSSAFPSPAMLRPVLEDRFSLRTRRVARDGPILALVVGKNGPKLQTPEPGDQPSTQGAPGRLIAKRMSMRQLASHLSGRMGRPVEDRTNLAGEFNFTLTFGPDDFQRPDPLGRPAVAPEAPVFETAIEEQLGLRLTNARGTIEMLVVDRAEKPAPD
jgi:uncharacterized protein (TIGR03435 family)